MYNITITIPTDQQELATAIGYGHGTDGCVEEQLGQHLKLTLYFAQEINANNAAASFAELLSVDEPTIEFIDDNQDWNAKWRESMEPAQIADGVWVSPTWLEPPAEGRKAWIRIEPKMAFGTGHHETTRLAAKELINRKESVNGKNVLDIGTGSGILCFVADYLGAKSATGVEIDNVCLENLAENLRDNPAHQGGRVRFVIGTLDCIDTDVDADTSKIPPVGATVPGRPHFGEDGIAINTNPKFDVVIMNMLSTESEPLLGQITSIIKNGALLIWSGILVDESDDVIDAAEKSGFRLIGCRTENEWWCGAMVLT